MQGAVEKALAARLERAVPGGADLLIHYHASVTTRLNVNGVDERYGSQPQVTEYEAGTLVVDLVDARTNRVVWRGFARDTVTLEDVLNDRDRMTQRINEAVTRMFKELPPSL
jgi:hypothetical protein